MSATHCNDQQTCSNLVNRKFVNLTEDTCKIDQKYCDKYTNYTLKVHRIEEFGCKCSNKSFHQNCHVSSVLKCQNTLKLHITPVCR